MLNCFIKNVPKRLEQNYHEEVPARPCILISQRDFSNRHVCEVINPIWSSYREFGEIIKNVNDLCCFWTNAKSEETLNRPRFIWLIGFNKVVNLTTFTSINWTYLRAIPSSRNNVALNWLSDKPQSLWITINIGISSVIIRNSKNNERDQPWYHWSKNTTFSGPSSY